MLFRQHDADLVRSARNGDRNAFAELLQPVYRSAFRLAYGVLQDDDEAEDVVQEATFTAWRRIGNLSEGSGLRPWFLVPARRRKSGSRAASPRCSSGTSSRRWPCNSARPQPRSGRHPPTTAASGPRACEDIARVVTRRRSAARLCRAVSRQLGSSSSRCVLVVMMARAGPRRNRGRGHPGGGRRAAGGWDRGRHAARPAVGDRSSRRHRARRRRSRARNPGHPGHRRGGYGDPAHSLHEATAGFRFG